MRARNLRLKAANFITGARILLAIGFIPLFLMDTMATRFLLPIIMLLILISDVSDGYVARRLGSASKNETGSVFDSLADDFVMVSFFTSLFSKEVIPLWFLVMVLWGRTFIAMIRLLALTSGKAYPKPCITTKAKGGAYWLSLLYLITAHSVPQINNFLNKNTITPILIAIMTLFTIIALLDFSTKNRQVFLEMFVDNKKGAS